MCVNSDCEKVHGDYRIKFFYSMINLNEVIGIIVSDVLIPLFIFYIIFQVSLSVCYSYFEIVCLLNV
jgi:hypothetical protein